MIFMLMRNSHSKDDKYENKIKMFKDIIILMIASKMSHSRISTYSPINFVQFSCLFPLSVISEKIRILLCISASNYFWILSSFLLLVCTNRNFVLFKSLFLGLFIYIILFFKKFASKIFSKLVTMYYISSIQKQI